MWVDWSTDDCAIDANMSATWPSIPSRSCEPEPLNVEIRLLTVDDTLLVKSTSKSSGPPDVPKMLPELVMSRVADASAIVPPPGWRMLTPVETVAAICTSRCDVSSTWTSCETAVPVISPRDTRPSLPVGSFSVKLMKPS